MVLHAGDFTNTETLSRLQKLPRFVGVAGNMDSSSVRSRLKEYEILELEGKKLCLIHGWGAPGPLPEKVRKFFDKEKPDIIVFGHSHTACEKTIGDVLMFNPGSAAVSPFGGSASYGILYIDHEGVRSEIIPLEP